LPLKATISKGLQNFSVEIQNLKGNLFQILFSSMLKVDWKSILLSALFLKPIDNLYKESFPKINKFAVCRAWRRGAKKCKGVDLALTLKFLCNLYVPTSFYSQKTGTNLKIQSLKLVWKTILRVENNTNYNLIYHEGHEVK